MGWAAPRIFNSVQEFSDLVDSYFAEIEEQNKQSIQNFGKMCRVPNIAGLCVHMGIHKDTFYEYAKKTDSNGNSYKDVTKNAVMRIESFKLESAATGQIREIMTIFDLKNNHGYTDKVDVNTNAAPEQITPEEIAAKLKEIKGNREKCRTSD